MDPDFLVIGAGVAGMRAAIELAEAGRVLVVAKESLRVEAYGTVDEANSAIGVVLAVAGLPVKLALAPVVGAVKVTAPPSTGSPEALAVTVTSSGLA